MQCDVISETSINVWWFSVDLDTLQDVDVGFYNAVATLQLHSPKLQIRIKDVSFSFTNAFSTVHRRRLQYRHSTIFYHIIFARDQTCTELNLAPVRFGGGLVTLYFFTGALNNGQRPL